MQLLRGEDFERRRWRLGEGREGEQGRRRVGAEEDAVDRKGFSLPEGVGVRPWETGAGGVILKRGAGEA